MNQAIGEILPLVIGIGISPALIMVVGGKWTRASEPPVLVKETSWR